MDTSALDFNTLTLLVAIVGSTLTVVTLMFRQFSHLDKKLDKLDTGVTGLETKATALEVKFEGLDGKVTALDAKFDVMARDVSDTRERLARVEGHLMAPEGFTPRTLQPPPPVDPPPEDSDPDHRQAG